MSLFHCCQGDFPLSPVGHVCPRRSHSDTHTHCGGLDVSFIGICDLYNSVQNRSNDFIFSFFHHEVFFKRNTHTCTNIKSLVSHRTVCKQRIKAFFNVWRKRSCHRITYHSLYVYREDLHCQLSMPLPSALSFHTCRSGVMNLIPLMHHLIFYYILHSPY